MVNTNVITMQNTIRFKWFSSCSCEKTTFLFGFVMFFLGYWSDTSISLNEIQSNQILKQSGLDSLLAKIWNNNEV